MPTKYSLWPRIDCLIAAIFVFIFVCPALARVLQESSVEVCGAEFQFVTIPPGTFNMGSHSGDGDERPVHKVTINYCFEISTTEVTVRQFTAFVEATGYQTDAQRRGGAMYCPCPDQAGYARGKHWQNPGFDQTETHPVVCVSYNDAKAFCTWFSKQSGRICRLPTEAEWEYACRAGTVGDFSGDIKQMAWFDRTAREGTRPVALKKANPWGLYDMHGNVWEWCEDIYRWHYRDAPADGSAGTAPDIAGDPISGRDRHVLRGGAWCKPATSCTSSFRCAEHRTFAGCGTGFRIVRCHKPRAGQTGSMASSAPESRKPSTADSPKPPEITFSVGDVKFNFVRIDPGTFIMGSERVYVDQYNWTYEFPAHEVTIGYSYYMGTTEVTLEQFNLFVEDTGYVTHGEKRGWAHIAHDTGWHYGILSDWRFPGFVQTENEPVTHISLYDAAAFCEWLSEKTGYPVRLPTEAEWEYACRAGTTGHYAGNLGEMAWCRWNSETIAKPHPVARKKANAWGLYDMHGNVWEWILDVWHEDCNGAPTDGSAWLESTPLESDCIARGGSFGNPPWLCRSYIRMRTVLGCMVHYNNGFRLAISPD